MVRERNATFGSRGNSHKVPHNTGSSLQFLELASTTRHLLMKECVSFARFDWTLVVSRPWNTSLGTPPNLEIDGSEHRATFLRKGNLRLGRAQKPHNQGTKADDRFTLGNIILLFCSFFLGVLVRSFPVDATIRRYH